MYVGYLYCPVSWVENNATEGLNSYSYTYTFNVMLDQYNFITIMIFAN